MRKRLIVIAIVIIAFIAGYFYDSGMSYLKRVAGIEHQPSIEWAGLNFQLTDDLTKNENYGEIVGFKAWWRINVSSNNDTVNVEISSSDYSTNWYFYDCVLYKNTLIKSNGSWRGCFGGSSGFPKAPVLIQYLLKNNRLKKIPSEMRKLLETALK